MGFSKTWDDGLVIRELTLDEHKQYIQPNHKIIFADSGGRYRMEDCYTSTELEKAQSLEKEFSQYRLRLGAFYRDQFAGWHFGRQESFDTFYMTNSAVLPEFRRRKIYQRLLEATMQAVVEKGFQCVTSQHHPTNNDVIIPKLRYGFHICGLQITDMFGMTVKLQWLANESRRDVFEFRTGRVAPSIFVRNSLLAEGR